ncbi:hypothetical protein V7x_53500 [Crateriforma conspicua]|uniref:Uncharacterized protein n=1 Tax=Crateriforma conspicua TaxID=2527996 RepID=A0A5C6FKB2_9PLAN|nr:hypothetical protein V7x_53500 [Crateriforma conspicua]
MRVHAGTWLVRYSGLSHPISDGLHAVSSGWIQNFDATTDHR